MYLFCLFFKQRKNNLHAILQCIYFLRVYYVLNTRKSIFLQLKYVCSRDPILHMKTEELKILVRIYNFIIKYLICKIINMCFQ